MRLSDTRIIVLAAGMPGEYTNVINAYAQPHGKGRLRPFWMEQNLVIGGGLTSKAL
jgi:hypothetical protein